MVHPELIALQLPKLSIVLLLRLRGYWMSEITNIENRGIAHVPPIQYIVEGGHRLKGAIEPSGNKNAALPIIAAALLSEHPVTLDNVPRIRDTETLVELIRSVGASAEWRGRCLPAAAR